MPKLVEKPLHVLDYTERSIAVIGSGTIDHSIALQKLGGKFNPNLRCGSGWIFSKTRKESVEKYIETGEIDPLVVTKKWEQKPKLTDLFKELREAFDSDEEYDGSTIHSVFDQIQVKYLKNADP